MKKIKILFILLLLYILGTRFITYENPEPQPKASPFPCLQEGQSAPEKQKLYPCTTLATIQQSYQQEIQPIFEQKCLMCHGTAKEFPLYVKIPPSSWLIAHNLKEAKEHMNMTWGFPFRGHHDLEEDLEEVEEVVEENEMPPWIYKIMHWHSPLTKTEAQKIIAWSKQARKQLAATQKNSSKPAEHDHAH